MHTFIQTREMKQTCRKRKRTRGRKRDKRGEYFFCRMKSQIQNIWNEVPKTRREKEVRGRPIVQHRQTTERLNYVWVLAFIDSLGMRSWNIKTETQRAEKSPDILCISHQTTQEKGWRRQIDFWVGLIGKQGSVVSKATTRSSNRSTEVEF